MVFNPNTDFMGLWRNVAGNVSKMEMPGLDYVVAALARAGVINLAVSATAPVVSQATTAWLKAAVPSYTAEGALFLWDRVTTTYLAATPTLFLQFLEACAGENGTSWWASVGGAPLNTVGNNGDYAIRTDEPGGVYGPKVAGAWPVSPLPGTTDIITSTELDNTFGAVKGQIIYRGAALWQALGIGPDGALLTASGNLPTWVDVSSMLDEFFGTARGSLLFRGAAFWQSLAAGTANQILATNGPAADPSWTPRTAEFPSGTVMLFNQTNAPTGWVKQVTINDYGLRVTSGAVGVTAGSAFSTVFAQTVVGDTTLSIVQMPSHNHPGNARTTSGAQAINAAGSVLSCDTGATAPFTGGGGAHAHSVNLTLAYVDVIIAAKS